MLFTATYADFKLIAAQFTGGKLFFCTVGGFRAFGMASGFPVLVLSLGAQPGSWAADFPAAIQLTSTTMTPIG
jgi:hypothetical protein